MKDNHETKNDAAVLSNGIFEYNLSKRFITGIKVFAEPFWKYFSMKSSKFNIKNIWPRKNILSTLGDVKSKNCDLLSACLMQPKLKANHWRKKILPEIIRFMCFWDINKNAKCKNAFVRSADPGIYSSIVSDVNFFRLMKNLRVKFSCCLWRNGHTMSSMTKSLKRVSWNYFNMSKQLGSIDWSKSKICYYLTPKWNHLVRKRSYLKYEFGANTLLSDAKTKQIWYLKIEKNWCGYVFISQ